MIRPHRMNCGRFSGSGANYDRGQMLFVLVNVVMASNVLPNFD